MIKRQAIKLCTITFIAICVVSVAKLTFADLPSGSCDDAVAAPNCGPTEDKCVRNTTYNPAITVFCGESVRCGSKKFKQNTYINQYKCKYVGQYATAICIERPADCGTQETGDCETYDNGECKYKVGTGGVIEAGVENTAKRYGCNTVRESSNPVKGGSVAYMVNITQ